MRMVIVGNGPSAVEYAKEIDKCDFVVRMNSWPVGLMGRKWNAWASSFSPWSHMQPEAIRHKLFDIMPKNLVAWVIGKPKSKWGYVRYKKGRPKVTFSPQGWKPISLSYETIGLTVGRWLSGYLRRMPGGRRVGPSTGFQTLGHALKKGPNELVLVGFDAIAEGKPGWGDSWNPMFGPGASVGHNFANEKKCIQHWLKTREFCGTKFPKTRPIWWRLKKHTPPPSVRATLLKESGGFIFNIELQRGNKWTRIGVFRAHKDGNVALTLEPQWRGKHLGSWAVRAGSEATTAKLGRLRLTARIKEEDAAARRAFERAGYVGRKSKSNRALVYVTHHGTRYIHYRQDERYFLVSKRRGRPRRRHARGSIRAKLSQVKKLDANRKKAGVCVVEPAYQPGRTQRKGGVPQRVYVPGNHGRRRQEASAAQKRRRRGA